MKPHLYDDQGLDHRCAGREHVADGHLFDDRSQDDHAVLDRSAP